jgi:hypothetical protein
MKRNFALAFVAVTAACGSKTMTTPTGDMASVTPADLATNTPPSDLAGVDLAGADLVVGGSYPAGPYGNTVGATIPPLVWEGYNDPLANAVATMKTYGPYTMDDLRKSGLAFGMIHVSDFA